VTCKHTGPKCSRLVGERMLAIHLALGGRLRRCQLLLLAQCKRPRTHHGSIVSRCVGRDLAEYQEQIDCDDAPVRKPPCLATRESLVHRGGRNRRHVHSEACRCPGGECSRATTTWASAEVLNYIPISEFVPRCRCIRESARVMLISYCYRAC
jgi:hypothetical protein